MLHGVTIANDHLELEVWPHFGGKVLSMIDKADGYELLFNYPAEIPENPFYDVPYSEGWYAGWDECFPGIGMGKYPGHPYEGVTVPDHGELWGLPTTAVPTRDGITTVWQGLRFGYRLTRKLYLQNTSIVAEYTLNNLAPFPFRYVWAMHSLMNPTQPAILQYAAGEAFQLSHDSEGADLGHTPFTWPTLPDGLDFSDPQALPAKRGWKVFSAQPITTPFLVNYPTRHRSLKYEFSGDEGLAAYWGIWMNTGGWGGHRHFAVEPTTGRYDRLDQSVRDATAATVAPSGKSQWTVTLTVSGL